MCGFVAIVSDRAPVERSVVERATRTLHHRGPDGQRTWLSPSGRVALGHARLSIIDLATGAQPIANETESVHVVVNGEFYDYERIQRELESRGHTLRTRSDSEVLLHLYEEVGTKALRQLRGEFAFALWDAANDVLVAGRDRFGIKPLFYARAGGVLYVASEIKALFAAGVPAVWDHESFFQNCQVALDCDRTLYEGVFQVPPGHYLLASRSSITLVPYWDFDYRVDSSSVPKYSDREHVDRLRNALDEAVKLRLRSDVPVGCFLSGGLDSSTVIALAAHHLGRPIDAFTVSFDADSYDEIGIARETAERFGAKLHVFEASQDMLGENFADAVWHAETTHANLQMVAKFLLTRLARDSGFKVMLTGEGADELLLGYAGFRMDLLISMLEGPEAPRVRAMLSRLAEEGQGVAAQSLHSLSTEALLPLTSVRQILGFVPNWIDGRARAGLLYRPLFSKDFAGQFSERDAVRMFLERLDLNGQVFGREPLHQSAYLFSKALFPSAILGTVADRMEMAHSIEGRMPFLDHHVVELVKDMPLDLKIRLDLDSGTIIEKHILREVAKPLVTETVYRRKKHPFMAPPLRAGSSVFRLMQDVFRGSALRDLPFFDATAVVDALEGYPKLSPPQQGALSFNLITILSACVLQERFKVASG